MTTTVDQLFKKAVEMGVAPATPEELSRALYEKRMELRRQSEERWRRERQEWARKILGPAGGFQVPARYESYTTQTLQKVCGGPNSEDYKAKLPAVLTMKDWAKGTLEKPGVLITGDPGTGKTALALVAFRFRAERTGESVLRVRYISFINAVQATYGRGNGGPSKEQLMRAAQIADLLLERI